MYKQDTEVRILQSYVVLLLLLIKVVMNTLNKIISFITGHFVKTKEIDFTLIFNKIKDSSFGYIAQQWLPTSVFRLKLDF